MTRTITVTSSDPYVKALLCRKNQIDASMKSQTAQSAVVVLKQETSTLRQSHNFISNDTNLAWVITLGRSPALPSWFLSKERSRRHVGQHIRVLYLFVCFVFVFSFIDWATAHACEPIFAYISLKDAVWCKKDSFGDEKYVVVNFVGVLR